MVAMRIQSVTVLLMGMTKVCGFLFAPHVGLVSRAVQQGQPCALSARSLGPSRVRQWRTSCMFSTPAGGDGVIEGGAQSSTTSTEDGEIVSPGASGDDETETNASSVPRVLVAGGSGFLGSEVCRQLVEAGCNVVSLSRGGRPDIAESWADSVTWLKGNALNQEAYRAELRKSDTVVSCVGGFGRTDAYMVLVNGEANIKLAEAAADAGVKRFIFISVHDYRIPGVVKRVGYFSGKRRAEKAVGDLFGSKGVVIRPALVYGERKVRLRGPGGTERTLTVPLGRVAAPLERITSTGFAKRIAGSGLPLADVAWTRPLSAASVAKSAVRCCVDGLNDVSGSRRRDSGDALVLDVSDIAQLAA